jgi:DNA-binding NarL/FixJ family response regulator
MKPIKILIADDHSVVRSGLRALLQRTAGFSVVAEASNGEEAVRLARELKPDVAILDISMPGWNGVEATRFMKHDNPALKIVVLTIHESEEYVWQVIRAGADGYVLKNADRADLRAAVRTVFEGRRFFSPSVSDLIVNEFERRIHDDGAPKPNPPGPLTKRETEVLRFVAQGMTNKEIAEKLLLSVRTVNTHRTNFMRKLDLHDTAGIVKYAIQTGLVDVNS